MRRRPLYLALALAVVAAGGPLPQPALARADYYVTTACYIQKPSGKTIALPDVTWEIACQPAAKECPGYSSADSIIWYSPGRTTLVNSVICNANNSTGPARQPRQGNTTPRTRTSTREIDNNSVEITVRSGMLDSGDGEEFSKWYHLCADSVPEGYWITDYRFRLRGDRECRSWANCALTRQDKTGVCYKFQMQGHNEGGDSIRQSEGVLTVTARRNMRAGADASRGVPIRGGPPKLDFEGAKSGRPVRTR